MRLFLISLGVTCLASVILFLYFRNRVGRMEQKVDLMFQLIQEYDKSKNIEPTRSFQQVPSTNSSMQMGGNVTHDDLISVSDDDDDTDRDTDSEEVSDNEDEEDVSVEEVLQIQEQVENIKSISLSGAEIESLAVEGGDDLDEISDLEDDIQDTITLDDKTNETNVDDDIIDDLDNSNEEEEEEEEIIDDENVDSKVKKIEVDSNKPLDKMTVRELKAKAEKDGFTNYKGLRKDKLVELLQSQ